MRNDTDYAPGGGPSDPEHHDPSVTEPADFAHPDAGTTAFEHTDGEHADGEYTDGEYADGEYADGDAAGSGLAPSDPELANAEEADAEEADAEEAGATSPDDERLITDADRAGADADQDAPDADRAEDDGSAVAEPYLATGNAAEDSAYPVADETDEDTDEPDDGAELSEGPAGRAGLDDGDTEDDGDAYDEALDDEPFAGQADADGEHSIGSAPVPTADEDHPVVDNFVDETSGADPYAPPEPADTSGPFTSAQIPEQAPAGDETGERADDERADAAMAEMQAAESMALAGTAAGVGYLAASRATDAEQAPAGDEEPALASDVEEAQPAQRDELMPGEAELAPMAVVIAAADAERLRQRWQQLQLRFIDDPQGTADEAQGLVGEVVQTLTAALASQRDGLEDWRGTASGDTEIFRAAVMRYRDFFDRLLSL